LTSVKLLASAKAGAGESAVNAAAKIRARFITTGTLLPVAIRENAKLTREFRRR
jgi:hypothetical protein